MSLAKELSEMKFIFTQAEEELKKLEGGRKSSASKVRKSLQTIKTSAHALRKSVTIHTKGLPVKSRVKKVVVEEPPEEPTEAQSEEVPTEEVPPIKKKRVRKKKE